MEDNILLMTDSYKVSHSAQYPLGTTKVYSYLESRGGKFDETVFFGLQYYLDKYLSGVQVTAEKIDEAEAFWNAHFGSNVFPRQKWEYILKTHGGKLPLEIRAVPEGTVVPVKHVLLTIENTDNECFWLTNFIETLILKVWYPVTVATLSYKCKQVIAEALEKSGTPETIDFKLHDFGYRGVSSEESAWIGGGSHLLNFMGTDTVAGIRFLQKYYEGGKEMFGFSIPASEHSTITSWGKENEGDAFENMLKQYPEGLVACVSDSYDITNACEKLWGERLKEKVLSRKGTLVVRPDSGDPVQTILTCLEILGERFGYTVNEKGFKVLDPHVRMIQGDGVNYESIQGILEAILSAGWSADNLAFGMGGKLLQDCNRDTQNFAIKCSYVIVNGEMREVEKSPTEINEKGERVQSFKKSKKGRLGLVKENGTFVTVQKNTEVGIANDILVPVFRNGEVKRHYKVSDVKSNLK